jgi:hypothetical protein
LDDGYATRLVSHRCPEIADALVPVSMLALMLDVVTALEERVARLSEAVEARHEADGYADERRMRRAS